MFLLPRPIERSINPTESVNGNDRKQHTFRIVDRWTGWKVMRVRIVACLLCLMMIGGSLDGLPDLPVVKPQGNQNNLVPQLHYHVPFAAKSHASNCLATAPCIRAGLFPNCQIFQNRGPSYARTLIGQATDTSPPCFS
jgi:hypothetical protein